MLLSVALVNDAPFVEKLKYSTAIDILAVAARQSQAGLSQHGGED